MFRVFLLLAGAALAGRAVAAPGLRASAVKVDITPQTSQWLMGYNARQSTGVHDKIYHRIAVIDDGTTRFVLVSSDLCLFSPSLYDDVAQEVASQTGIERKNLWWTVTHTHSAPEVGSRGVYKALLGRSDHEWDREYTNTVKQSLIDGVRQATERLEPAQLGIGTGNSVANINRRAKDVDGTVSLGLNPEGPADRQIGLIRLDRPDGRPIALIANYSMHGTVLSGESLVISGDAPGVVAAYVEEKIGAPMLYINGAAGNIAPIYSVYPNPSAGHLGQFRVLLGNRILEAEQQIKPVAGRVRIRAVEKTISTPMRAGLEWPDELSRYAKPGSTTVDVPVRLLAINDLAIWAAPVELFCEISMRIRKESPFPQTFYFGYANGWLGYLPTAEGFAEGGYEPKTSVLTKDAEGDITRGVLAALKELRKQ